MKRFSLLGIIMFALVLTGCESIPLVGAARKGDVAMMESLVQDGADINQAEYGHTPLYGAAQRGNAEAVKYLIEEGADTELGPFNSTPLTVALKEGHRDIVDALVQGGANVNKSLYQITTFFLSSPDSGSTFMTDKKQVEIAKILVAKGADVNYVHSEFGGNTVLHAVAKKGDSLYLLADYLNKSGADNTIKNDRGFTAPQSCRDCGPGMTKIINGAAVEDL